MGVRVRSCLRIFFPSSLSNPQQWDQVYSFPHDFMVEDEKI